MEKEEKRKLVFCAMRTATLLDALVAFGELKEIAGDRLVSAAGKLWDSLRPFYDRLLETFDID